MTPRSALVFGGTGYVGRFLVEGLLKAGHAVTVGGRTPPASGFFSRKVGFVEMSLDPTKDQRGAFDGMDVFVHAAFDHVPGKYRGGEGDDPDGFRRRNHDGSMALFSAARDRRVGRAIFLSSRAVYGAPAAGIMLAEDDEPRPDTLYGAVKRDTERDLSALADENFATVSLRITGVYGPAGPGREDKWAGLFRDYLAGQLITPRAATEVHGEDVASAVLALLDHAGTGGVFNVSDLVIDRHDILAPLQAMIASEHILPERADASTLNVMTTDRLRRLGWSPGGRALFDQTIARMARQFIQTT